MSALKDAAARIAADPYTYWLRDSVDGHISRDAFENAAAAFNDWAEYQDDDAEPRDAMDDGADHEHADRSAYTPGAWYEAHHDPDEWIEQALSEFGAEIAMDSGNIMQRLKELGAYMEANAAFNAVMDTADEVIADILADREEV